MKPSDYLVEWNVSEDDEDMTPLRFVVTFLTFVLVLAALFSCVLLVWAGQQ